MADQLYLSLWFPNFRLDALPAKLICVLRQFSAVSGDKRISAATVYPIDFTEAPTYQRIYVNDQRAEENRDTSASIIETAVAEATEQLHDDIAYEFDMRWNLFFPPNHANATPAKDTLAAAGVDPEAWTPLPRTVRILGFGPQFDQAGYEQNGHIRIDFGLDSPWLLNDEDGAPIIQDANDPAAVGLRKNIELLLAFALSVEKHCGISSRLLWNESGEPLAERLVAGFQRLN